MADNTTLNTGSGGDVIRTEDRTTFKTPVSLIDVGGTAGEALIGDLGVALPTRVDALPVGLLDSFGHLVSGSINNQIDIQWYRSDGTVDDLITETNANGGTATATGGMATFACTTTASSQAKGVTDTSTHYTAGAEIYCIFTAAFTGTGSGTSYQRIGLYDTNDGFFIGYEGGTFNVTVRKGTSDTSTAKGSWNLDTLTGGSTSLFTRGGTPEAVDLTKLNVYRIRFGWVGSAPIKFEILAPDGHWVTFHEIRQPNNAALPSIENADLPVTCDVNGGNSAAALSILTNCWCAGTTAALGQLSATLNQTDYAQLTRSVITGWSTAGGGNFVNVKVNTSGAMSVAATQDGTWNVGVTELPTAAALTDNFANPTTTTIASMGMLWDGATWDRMPGNSTDGVLVNLGTNNDVVVSDGGGSVTVDSGAGSLTVNDDGSFVVQSVGSISNPVEITELPAAATLTDAFANPTTTNAAAMNMLWNGSSWDRAPGGTADGLLVNLGTNNDVSQNGTWTVQPGNTANTTPWLIAEATRTSGGPTTYHLVSAATTNATSVKASAGQLYGWYIYNTNAAMRKVAFHNTAGTPTAGSSVYFSLCIPPTSGANVFLPHGIPFSTGIAITTVTEAADTGTTAVAADDLVINLWYA